MTGVEVAIIGALVATSAASTSLAYVGKMEQAEAIREQARVERGATESNIGLRMAQARRRAARARAQAGASGVNPLVGSPIMSELGIIAVENQQAGILRQNAESRSRMANEAASNIELSANIGLGVGLAGSIAGGALLGAGLAGGGGGGLGGGVAEVDVFGQSLGPGSALEATYLG